jgi:ABC-type amino acid transport substrate-binding protein
MHLFQLKNICRSLLIICATALLVSIAHASDMAAASALGQAPVDLTLVTIESRPLTVRQASGYTYAYGAADIKPYLAKCGITANVMVAPSWSRAYAMAAAGRVDALMPTNKSPKRKKLFFFPKTAFSSMDVIVFTHRDSPATRFTGFEMFKGKKLGRISGALLTIEFDKFVAREHIELSQYATLDSLYEALTHQKIDFAVDQALLNKANLALLADEKAIRALWPPVASAPLYVAISKLGSFAQNPDSAQFKCLMR